jgi:hypothetical protein
MVEKNKKSLMVFENVFLQIIFLNRAMDGWAVVCKRDVMDLFHQTKMWKWTFPMDLKQ